MQQNSLVLVTGGAGFIGSHLCERLAGLGHRVISLDNYFTGSRENHVPGVEYREGHTKDVARLVPETPDLVFHLGEYSRVEKSFEDAEQVWDLNLRGTFAVLEFCRHRGSKLVYAGSSTKFADDGLGRDQSPYAWSKAANTELVRNYGSWYGLRYAIAYFYNVYGPRESSSAYGTVVAIFKEQYARGAPRTVVSPGTQERIFTHVEDIVDGLLRVGASGEGDGYGIGGEDRLTILELANLFGSDVLLLPERKGNRARAAIDTDRTRALGWAPMRSLAAYVGEYLQTAAPAPPRERRVLVFATTFHPVCGPAEDALIELARRMPDLQFDVVAATHRRTARQEPSPLPNIAIHRVGLGSRWDKLLLPIHGARLGARLARAHAPLFAWSLVASYGALAAVATKRATGLPVLVTLADQRLSWIRRLFLRLLIGRTDQVYATLPEQASGLAALEDRLAERQSLGAGDAVANQLRFAYSAILRSKSA